MVNVRPIRDGYGTGFTASEVVDAPGYRYEQVGHYHNYHYTKDNWKWLESFRAPTNYIVDGFAPNLNKLLHVGHLRNLAIANCLSKVMPKSQFVALLGASLGSLPEADEQLKMWFDFLDYHPKTYYDVLIPKDAPLVDGQGDQAGCKVWVGPNGSVICVRSDGRPTYAYQDLSFAKLVAPTHYITGAEQIDHFASLGLGDKHLPMGLVLGTDNKKLKSRTGDAMSAVDALQSVQDALNETEEPRKLAWNILCWNFLHSGRKQNVKYDVAKWIQPESPGMYVSYTYARIGSALKKVDLSDIVCGGVGCRCGKYEFNQKEIDLLGYSHYIDYWLARTVDNMCPAALASFAHDLARKLGVAYHTKTIVGSEPSYLFALHYAWTFLGDCMKYLGMFPLERV